jgi:lysophospholipase L1-like esterase
MGRMNNFLNKNILIIGLVLVLLIFGIFYFIAGNDSYTNYPSKGTDIIAFGDSLIQGVGASSNTKSLVGVLSKKIGKPIINLGVSGNTTADGLNRINELDRYKPKVVILLLGGNDYLRKVPKETTFKNLGKIIEDIQSRGAVVLLLGVRGENAFCNRAPRRRRAAGSRKRACARSPC